MAALASAGMCALVAARSVEMTLPLAGALFALLGLCVAAARRFVSAPLPASGKRFEALSWLWTVSMYLTLGLVPLVWRAVEA
jgi:hypothetical protein